MKAFSTMNWDGALPDFHDMGGITWVTKSSKTSAVRRGQSFRARWPLDASLTQPLFFQCYWMGFLKLLEQSTINWWLKIIGMYSLTVLRLVVQHRCIRRAMFPLQGLGTVFPCLFLASDARWQSLVFLGLETHHFNLRLFRPVIFFLGRSVCAHFPFLI